MCGPRVSSSCSCLIPRQRSVLHLCVWAALEEATMDEHRWAERRRDSRALQDNDHQRVCLVFFFYFFFFLGRQMNENKNLKKSAACL